MPYRLTNARFTGQEVLQGVLDGTSPLTVGATGPAVVAIQSALKDLGFNLRSYRSSRGTSGGVDGAYGRQTQTAVRNFEAFASRYYAGIRPTGSIGAETLMALDSLSPPPDRVASQDPRTPRPVPRWRSNGTALRIVVVKAEHRTFVYGPSGALTGIFPNAIGKPGQDTDTGLKQIVGKLNEQDAAQVGQAKWGDPTVFGARILNLSWYDGRSSGEELHGTNRPDQMGMNVSHGCIRHYNEDIIVMFEQVKLKDLVAVVEWIDDPVLESPGNV